MNKVELNKYIESICKQIPIVHSFYTDDVYEVWATDDIQYGSVSFVITNSSISDNVTNWTGMIYYADRLLEDKSNRDSVQTDANNAINAIMNAISMDDDIITINYPTEVTFFEQRFVDLLAGGYASIQIGTDNSISKCGYGFVKEVGGCESAIKELEDEIEVLEEKNDRLSDLLGTANEALDQAQNNLTECRASNESLIESNQQLETENDRLESEIERLEESLSILPDYTSIGYNLETAGNFIDYEKLGIEYALSIKPELETGNYAWSKFQKDPNIIYIPAIDNPDRHFTDNFRECENLKYVPSLKYGSASNTFYGCYSLEMLGDMYVKWAGTGLSYTFQYCKSLREIPKITFEDGSILEKMTYTFNGCESLRHAKISWDTSNVTDISGFFYNCKLLDQVDLFDTSSVTTMEYTFNGCSKLKTVPQFDYSNVQKTCSMFFQCSDLESVPELSMPELIDASRMFQQCSSLTHISLINLNKLDTIYYGCYYCSSLEYANITGTSNCTNFGYLFYQDKSLKTVEVIDMSSASSTSTMFGSCSSLENLGGFIGLKVNLTLSASNNITVQSMLNVFNTIADVNGLGTRTLTLGTTNLNKLTDDQKAIATAKGWTLK